MDYQLTTLDNGLRVATLDMPGMQTATLGVWTGIGARYESAGRQRYFSYAGAYGI